MNIFDPHISGSLSVSGSGEISGDLRVLGTISGSIKGDGSQIFNIPSSGVTGLNLTRIADGSATASISQANGLLINTNTEITGNLKVNKINVGTNSLVTISVTDSGGKYFIDGVRNPQITLVKGFTYRFLYPNIGAHPFRFSTTNDGTHNGGVAYTTGVTIGASPDYIQIEITDSTPSTLYYYCTAHSGMGNSISVLSDILNLDADRNIVYIEPSRIATTGSNTFVGTETVSGSLSVTGSVNITGSITLNGQAIGTGKLDETTFQSYTSSNDSRVSSLESSTGSLNTFTSSIDSTIKNKLNTETVISGSVQVLITGTTGYSTFSSSISTSIGSLSSSVATTTSGLSSSVDSISSSVATTTSGLSSSIGSLSSSVATTTLGLSSSIDALSSSVATTTLGLSSSLSSSIGSLSSSVATTTSGLSSSIDALSSSVATTTLGLSSSLSSSIVSLSSSVATTTLNIKNRVDSIETSTGSLNSFTSSINTTIKSKLDSESVISGSIQVLITGTTGYSTFSSSIATTTNDLSSSVATTTSGLTFSISSLSSSAATTTLGLSSSIGSLSSSVATTTLTTKNRVDSIEGKTGSYATTGSNIFQGSQTITGSLYISQDLIVAGSSSIQYISSSIVNIDDNIITVNALNPSVRFGGLAVIDSGSSPQVSGSMLFDSVNNQWLFVHQDQASVTSSVLLMGPETYNNLGGEAYLTLNRIPKGTGIEHLNDSNITDNGTKVSINSNTEVTGTLKVTGVISGPTITAIETSTSSLNTFTSSLLTAIELTGSNLTVRGDFLVKGTTTNVNTSTLNVDNNLINLNGNGASFAGLRVKDTTAPNQVSGSLLWDAANDYWIGGQLGSEQRLVRETEFNNAVTRIGNVETSTGSLNSFTSSINTTIKNKLNSDGVISGSVQVNHNATTNYVANQHIDHTTVSITAGSGLTGGGDISSTRTINIGAGNGITVNADDIAIDTASATFTTGVKSKLNTDGVISGSAQIDGSLLGSNKTITIGSTSTTLGGTSTSLAGLTSVTSTAFTGSLQGLATSETLSTVTGRGNTTTDRINVRGIGNQSGGNILMGNIGVNTNKWSYLTGTHYNTSTQPQGVSIIGLYSDLNNNSIIIGGSIYEANPATEIQFWTHNATSHATGGTLKMTLNSAGNLIITGTVSASNFSGTSSGTNTGDETLARVNALAITTVGTITSGVWNGTAIGNAYLANSSFYVGTTSISLGRASASQTLTGVSIDGASASAPILTASGGLTTQQGSGTVGYVYALSSSTTGLFAAVDNSNSILTVNRHPDNYYSQLGFSSNGNLYYRSFSATAINTSQAWKTIIDSGNIGSQTVTNITASSNTSLTSLANLATVGTISTGVWNGTAIGDSYISSASNWNTAYNKRPSSLGFTSSTVTLTLGDATTITASVPTFNQNTTGTSSNITAYTINQNVGTSNSPTFTGLALGDGVYTYNDTNRDAGAAAYYPNAWTRGFRFSFANASSTSTAGNYSGVLHFHPWDGTTASTGDASYQLAFGSTATNGGGTPQLRLRKGIDTTWNSWYTVPLKATASFSSVSSVTVTHNFNTKDVMVMVYDNNDEMFWPSTIVTTSVNVVTITFTTNRTGRVVIIG